MRHRSDRDRMLKRVDRWRGLLRPGGDPIEWVVPDGADPGSPAWDALIQQQIKHVRDRWSVPGWDLQLELVSDDTDFFLRGRPPKIRFSAVRRDTSSLRRARWLSETPRGPRDD